ncbi:MAG TPA: rhomboid family intramembrane serine protease, partial [Puia sp.]
APNGFISLLFPKTYDPMAFGFNSRQSLEIPLQDLTPEQFITLAADTAHRMGWGIYFINATGLTATTSEEPFVHRDKVILRISNGIAHIDSWSTGVKMPTAPTKEKPTFPRRRDKPRSTIQDFATHLEQARKLVTPEQLTETYERNREQLAPADQDVSSQAPPTRHETWKGIAGYFIPRKNYFITPVIIDLNVLVFLLMVLSGVSFLDPDGLSLVQWGADYTPDTLGGEWWRLITSCFLHAGILHLLMNMYAFLYIGMVLEPFLGRWKFSIAYLLAGIISSLTSLYWHKVTLSVGASGAIFGMYGLFLAMLTTNLIHAEKRKPLLKSIGIFVLFNLGFGTLGSIDNAAHIGGLVSGILMGYILYPALKRTRH